MESKAKTLVRIGRDAMEHMAPTMDADLLDGVEELLGPVTQLLDTVSGGRSLPSPGLVFDPVDCAGGRTWTSVLIPDPPATDESRSGVGPAERDLPWLPAASLGGLVDVGKLSAVDVLEAFIRRVEQHESVLNAFIRTTLDMARSRARGNPRGRLAGVPVGLKDLIDVRGVLTTCGSAGTLHRMARADAAAWGYMRDQGALHLGKLNTQELAAGVTADNDHFGAVRNPWALDRMSGGSSGGSAAAVAAALVSVSLGTDTGGSVRVPASFCGVVGLKPTTGIVPTAGVQPLAWSLDAVGPVARSVRDVALCLDLITGTRCESAALAGTVLGLKGVRIAVPRSWVSLSSPHVHSVFEQALATLEAAGARIVDAPELPDLALLTALNRIIAYAEGSNCHEAALRDGTEFGPLIRARMEAGRFITSGQYLAAQRLRREVCERMAKIWSVGDLLVLPTVPCSPPLLREQTVILKGRPERLGNALVAFTAPFNLTGTPAITLPCGWDPDGLPVGLQFSAPPHADALVCYAAAVYESRREDSVSTRRPRLLP